MLDWLQRTVYAYFNKHINFLCHIANNIVAVFVTGNVSEYQASELADAISEAASVRSERSTNLDDAEDEDDNLSDMVSANVSGRGECAAEGERNFYFMTMIFFLFCNS